MGNSHKKSLDGPLPKLCPAVALSHQDGHHSAVALLLKAALIQVSDYRLLGASGLFWNDVSFVPVRVLHKDENIMGRKHIYLPHAQTAIYDSMVVIFKTGNIPSTWSWLNAVVRFECENSAIDVIINFLWKIFHKPIVLVVSTTANF